MAAELIDITDQILHPAVYKSGPRISFSEFCNKKAPYLYTPDSYSKKICCYTNEQHRRTWACMIKLAFDVRHKKYILSKETFEDDNLVMVDGSNLRFLKIIGRVSDGSSKGDFAAIADKIRSVVAGAGTMLEEVAILIHALKNYNPTNSYNRAFLLCNYATMQTDLRKAFLMSLSHKLYSGSSDYDRHVRVVCANYEKTNKDWRKMVTADEDYPICKTYRYRNYPGHNPLSVMEFVRNGLHHLSDNSTYSPDDTWYIMDCYFSKFMSTVQHELFLRTALDRLEMFNFQPVTF